LREEISEEVLSLRLKRPMSAVCVGDVR
jgi:hypothetical protein